MYYSGARRYTQGPRVCTFPKAKLHGIIRDKKDS